MLVSCLWYGGLVKKQLIVAPLVAAALLGGGFILWNPVDPCKAPSLMCEAFDDVRSMDGVDSISIDYKVLSHDPKDGDTAQAQWRISLSEELSPAEASSLATQAQQRLTDVLLGDIDLQQYSQFTVGSEQEIANEYNQGNFYPLSVIGSENLGSDIEQGYELRRAGAGRVSSGSVFVRDAQSFRAIAEFAATRGYRVAIETDDGTLRYTPDNHIDLEVVDLVLEAGARPEVQSANYQSKSLSLHTVSEEKSAQTMAVKDWVEQRIPPQGEPLKYVISSPGFSTIIENWVGLVLPPELIPRPVQLPQGVQAWAKDSKAPRCTADDVQLELGTPDAATGSRYLAVYAKNISSRPCAVKGIADLEFATADGLPQTGVRVSASANILVERIVIPVGEYAMSAIRWGAMSTANDPDETTTVKVGLLPGFATQSLTPRIEDRATSLDILDGAELETSPWVQALDGWSKPAS